MELLRSYFSSTKQDVRLGSRRQGTGIKKETSIKQQGIRKFLNLATYLFLDPCFLYLETY
jgi:hypothetical protein